MNIILIAFCDGVSGISIKDNVDFLEHSSHIFAKRNFLDYYPNRLYYIESVSSEFFEDFKSNFSNYESELKNGVFYYDYYSEPDPDSYISGFIQNFKSKVLSRIERIKNDRLDLEAYNRSKTNEKFLMKSDIQIGHNYIVFCKSTD